MARRSRQTILKRQRERKKAEKAELKREQRAQRRDSESSSVSPVASLDDLAGYGLVHEPGTEQANDHD